MPPASRLSRAPTGSFAPTSSRIGRPAVAVISGGSACTVDLCCNNLRLASRSPRVAQGRPSASSMWRSTSGATVLGRPVTSCHSTAIPARFARSRIASSLIGRPRLIDESAGAVARQSADAACPHWRTAGRPAGRSNGTASASRLLASVSIAPSPSRQRATTAFGPITSAASARAPSSRGTIAVARNAMSRR